MVLADVVNLIYIFDTNNLSDTLLLLFLYIFVTVVIAYICFNAYARLVCFNF